eukprot:jgi/Undpi1/4458/HiC_scaffold_17.g07812.m1
MAYIRRFWQKEPRHSDTISDEKSYLDRSMRPHLSVKKSQVSCCALRLIHTSLLRADASWLFIDASEKQKNPSTSLVLSNDVYAYPDTWVCLHDTYGCDDYELEEQCLNSSTLTEGGGTRAIFYPDGEYEQEVSAVGRLTTNGWCLDVKTSDVTVFLGEERDSSNYLDYFLLDMYWYPGGSAGASTTCVPDGEGWKSHKEWVYIYLHDPTTNITSTGIQTSYSCITSASSSHTFTYLGIGLTEQRNLKKDDVASYNALSVTTSIFKDEVKANVTDPYAYLAIQLQQEPNSYEIVTEIDPFDVAEMLGNIGGFWDLILILWPIFFVAATQQEPHLKTREFLKPARKAAEQLGGTVGIPGPLKHIMASSGGHGRSIDTAEQQIERPYWEPASSTELPAQRPTRGFGGWTFRSRMVSSPRVAPASDNHC